jgi:Ca-activated chloride channel homolog
MIHVGLEIALSDTQVDASQTASQRQAAISVFPLAANSASAAPLNLCLVLDRSGSMQGNPLDTIKKAAKALIEQLSNSDILSIVAFDHQAIVLVPSQTIGDRAPLLAQIDGLKSAGGTNIDDALKAGIEELAKAKKGTVSQLLLLTDGENEHGNNDRCQKLAHLAAEYNMTLNVLGLGDHWNQDVLEALSDAASGTLLYVQQPEQAAAAFTQVLGRAQSVRLTNAYLKLTLAPGVRLSELKPIAQVSPETIELLVQKEGDQITVRLGDLMVDAPRVVLANLYLDALAPGETAIAQAQVIYDHPGLGQTNLQSEPRPITIHSSSTYQAQPNPTVQTHILALAKYRQTQIADSKLSQGDRTGAATMLQTAAQTALQMGDHQGATILQTHATQLQSGQSLSEGDRKATRIAAKTVLQG